MSRVTQHMMYSSTINDLNSSLSAFLDTQKQMNTQLKVNKPSDDPAGAGRAISLRASIDRLSQYTSNISTATGWLKSTDSTLSSVQELLSSIKALAQQGADGTKTAENRRQIAFELRENFNQLINLANTTYNGKSIFAGHKTDNAAYELALGVTNVNKATSADGKDLATSTGSFSVQTQVMVTSVTDDKVEYSYREWDEASTPPTWGDWSDTKKALNRGSDTELKLPNSKSLTVNTTKGNLKDLKDLISSGGSVSSSDEPIFTVMDSKAVGNTSVTTIIQATADDGSGATGRADDPNVKFRYSIDGGLTWQDATKTVNTESNTVSISAGGSTTEISADAWVEKVNPDNTSSTGNGSWLFLRPTAVYKGDDHDTQVVTKYGAKASGSAEGFFSEDVVVKITNVDTTTNEITYAYSLDNGTSWAEGRKTPLASNGKSKLPIPGGFLNLDETGGNSLKAGDQFTVHPHRADLNLAISDTDSITTNMVGKDIFGGTYTDPLTGKLAVVDGGSSGNVFEVVGRLIGYAESGMQEGMQKALDELQTAMETVLTASTLAGGRLNRLEVTENAIQTQTDNETKAISAIEDADYSDLLLKLQQQKTVYTAVAQSSSTIMQLSLMNFL